MKRTLTVFLIAITVLGASPMTAQARTHGHPICDGRRVRGIVPRLGYTEVRHRVRDLLLPCAVARFPVDGGLRMARCIADRESSYWPWAKNPYSTSWGTFQIIDTTWASWYRAYDLVRRWIKNDRLDPYSGAMLGIRAMSDSLSPWGGGC